jgi:hypothetical protein
LVGGVSSVRFEKSRVYEVSNRFALESLALLVLHLSPTRRMGARATQIMLVLEGTLDVGFVTMHGEEARHPDRAQGWGGVFVFPRDLMHFERKTSRWLSCWCRCFHALVLSRSYTQLLLRHVLPISRLFLGEKVSLFICSSSGL